MIIRNLLTPLVAILSIACLLRPVVALTCTSRYSVKSGDSCDAIASSNGISNYQLTHLNGDSLNCAGLSVGQELCLRSKEYDCSPVVQVKSGDGCYAIADANGISLDQFYADNPGIDCGAIYAGYSVCVSKTTPASGAGPSHTSTTTSSASQLNSGDQLCASLQSGQALCVDGAKRSCGKPYTIQSGDSCYAISQTHNLTLAEFYDINSNIDENCSNIQPDEVVCVAKRSPNDEPPASSNCSRFASVRVADTCEKIAARSSLTSVQLRGLNYPLDCSHLRVGDQLCTFAPDANFCPQLHIVKHNDTCYDLAQNASMSLQEWTSVNDYGKEAVDCDALILSSIVCQAHGNATLPAGGQGNSTDLPLCSKCNDDTHCCSKYSVCAPLASDFCKRDEGCQGNCQGDQGVSIPDGQDGGAGPIGSNYTNVGGKDMCLPSDTWYCLSTNGCVDHCTDIADLALIADPQFTQIADAPTWQFPSGDFPDGDPCACGDDFKCCASSGKYLTKSQDEDDCYIGAGCLYNCYDVRWSADENEGSSVVEVKHPYSSKADTSSSSRRRRHEHRTRSNRSRLERLTDKLGLYIRH
ncbi:Chitinase [Ceraceosorus bombacis]|uniref:Chitinase n=1 Tax=Ceraceosorus bombacis TaxID=401625 RepID=A0A0P1BKJ2_9BASI|nr:Chitinase [Ceraceosorus bombacis]